jgi:aerobic carbon-monoxide dehydrogenase medium subunit
MITTSFEYSVPASMSDLLEQLDSGAKPLAGGMSLVPMMKLRFAQPEHLVDIARLSELRYICENGSDIKIGATSTHQDVMTNPLMRAKAPLLVECASEIGDIQVRNVGTIGGSVAHADPAADYPAALLAAEARLVLVSKNGTRTVTAEEIFVDTLTTCLAPNELIATVLIPQESQMVGTRYQKVPHPASGYAMVGVAVRIQKTHGKISLARVAITGLSGMPYRAKTVEAALSGASSFDEFRAAAEKAADNVEAVADTAASAEFRSHLARVHTFRAVQCAFERAT